MAVLKTREEFMARVEQLTGDATDDGTLAAIADISDTYDSMSGNETGEMISKEEHEADMKALDDTWRKKMKDTFFHGVKDSTDYESEETEVEETEKKTYEDLFTEEKEK